jgi:hypothetical protein
VKLGLLPPREDQRLKELEERVQRRIFAPKREDVTGWKN